MTKIHLQAIAAAALAPTPVAATPVESKGTVTAFSETRSVDGIILRDVNSFGFSGVCTKEGASTGWWTNHGLVIGKDVKIVDLKSKPGHYSLRFIGRGKWYHTLHLRGDATILVEGVTTILSELYEKSRKG